MSIYDQELPLIWLLSFINQGPALINPHPTKWGPMRPYLIINIYHSSLGWTMCSRFKEFVLMYKPPWMEILLLYYAWIRKCGAHFPVGVQIDPSNKNKSNDSDDKNKNKRTNPINIKANTFMHLILPLIFKKSVVTIVLNLWWGPNWPQQVWFVLRC